MESTTQTPTLSKTTSQQIQTLPLRPNQSANIPRLPGSADKSLTSSAYVGTQPHPRAAQKDSTQQYRYEQRVYDSIPNYSHLEQKERASQTRDKVRDINLHYARERDNMGHSLQQPYSPPQLQQEQTEVEEEHSPLKVLYKSQNEAIAALLDRPLDLHSHAQQMKASNYQFPQATYAVHHPQEKQIEQVYAHQSMAQQPDRQGQYSQYPQPQMRQSQNMKEPYSEDVQTYPHGQPSAEQRHHVQQIGLSGEEIIYDTPKSLDSIIKKPNFQQSSLDKDRVKKEVAFSFPQHHQPHHQEFNQQSYPHQIEEQIGIIYPKFYNFLLRI